MPDQNEIGQVLFTAKKKKKPWKNGFYKMGDLCLGLARVRGPQQTFYQLKFLEHEDQSEQEMKLEEKEGEGEVAVTLLGETVDGRVNKEGNRITGTKGLLAFFPLVWIPEAEAERLQGRLKDPIFAPIVPYPMQPTKQGRLVFISGPPGSGKSTIASIIAERERSVFYEGDGFLLGFNPYLAPGENQVIARGSKHALIGPGMRERLRAMMGFAAFVFGQSTDVQLKTKFLTLLAEDIAREKQRVGGSWVVTFSIRDRADRDIFRRILGEQVHFVVLNIDLELQSERLSGRSPGEEKLLGLTHPLFKPAESDEPNSVNFKVVKGASSQSNVSSVLGLLK